MRTYLYSFILLLMGTPLILHAQQSYNNANELSKPYYTAKQELENMLDGKLPLSYERAIYLIENAWWDNEIDYPVFQSVISSHLDIIKTMIEQRKGTPKRTESHNLWDQLRDYNHQKEGYYDKALANWAIYSYMTDTVFSCVNENGLKYYIDKTPFFYSTNDPLGSTDWTNTQVTNLFLNGKGNCFALVSLFKILSERLHSDASICTAPGHVYISHKDDQGRDFNVEIASRAFPGIGTLSTLTHTTQDAIVNDISLRQLNLKQSVALCLIYLAKGYEHKLQPGETDGFMMSCANSALKYDSLNLNAMLLKAEILEKRIIQQGKTVAQLQANKTFYEYESLITQLYQLGYREMPLSMKNILIKGWMRDTVATLAEINYRLAEQAVNAPATRKASLSWGLFDEEINSKPTEKYGRTVYDTKKKKIATFTKEEVLYNNYNFDPVVFAWNVDPLAHKLPSVSPYAFCNDNPIANFDPDGAFPYSVHVRSFAPFETFGGGFEGDNRRYSTVLGKAEIGKSGVTSRLQQSFTMNTDTRSIYGLKTWSDPSYHPLRGTKTAKDKGAISDFKVAKTSNGNEIFSFTATMAGANPLVPASPDIDVKTRFSLMEDKKLGKVYVNATMTGDRFPAAETFIGDTKGQQLFIGVSPYDGNPYTSLPGNNDRSMMSSSFEININSKGEFTGVQQGDNTYTIEQWNGMMQSKPIEYKAPAKQ